MGPRWKGKGSEAKALADPMSKIVSQLQSPLIQSDCHGLLSGCSVLLGIETEQTELFNRACFGRPRSQYGVDFVAYRHHPALVHSEYAVLVLSEEDDNANGRLRVWSDFHCTLRLCGSVAKTLLALRIGKNGAGDVFPSCLERYSVEERTITRWSAERSCEGKTIVENGTA
ncbi:splicing endonuclease 2 [Actinidia rufa]|uniref:tRNA-intron lyase n=1 Tax=Actinidia rufa TaxID=165716 RepID=A0A7J0GQW2_9ERIC|nr:splicing endonuclease 2 [Actinidia rufa]